MTTLYKKDGTSVGGIYFNKTDGTLGQTVVSQINIPGLVVGEKLIISAETTVSLLQNLAVPYYGWAYNTYTASELFLCRHPQSNWYDNTGIAITGQSGEDINPGGPSDNMQPYHQHTKTGMHEIVAGQEGDWTVAFVVWASCYNATGNSVAKNEYLWVVPQQTGLSVMRFPS